jgi:hypothetical protein
VAAGFVSLFFALCLRAEETLPWLGAGTHRVLVEVPPVPEFHRTKDEMVANYKLELAQLFPQQSGGQRIDLYSLEVIRQARPSPITPR